MNQITKVIVVPICNKNFFLIHISTNEIAKLDHNAFLSESEFRNLSPSYHSGGDSSLVPQIANARDWSNHRFRQRLWPVCFRQNKSDFHQFSWSPAFSDIIFINESNLFTTTDDFFFLTLKSWFYSCMPPANTADIHFHSLWEASTPQRQKRPILFFSLAKNFIQDLWLFRCSSCFSLVKKIIWPIRICAVYYKSYSFFSNLTWSKSLFEYNVW